MSILHLLSGALRLRTETFQSLRERSDVFYRGFLVVLVVGLLTGAFAAAVPLIEGAVRPPTEAQVTQQITQGITGFSPAAGSFRATIEAYVREAVGISLDIRRLRPNAGRSFDPVARALDWLGQTLATPFSFSFAGLLLLGGILVQLVSSWLGGRAALAQMLGLTGLAWAPRVLNPISSLLVLGQDVSASGALGALNSFLGFVLLIWGAVIYIKGTAVAQGFSYGKALGAFLLAGVILLVLVALFACVFGGLIAALLIPVSSTISR